MSSLELNNAKSDGTHTMSASHRGCEKHRTRASTQRRNKNEARGRQVRGSLTAQLPDSLCVTSIAPLPNSGWNRILSPTLRSLSSLGSEDETKSSACISGAEPVHLTSTRFVPQRVWTEFPVWAVLDACPGTPFRSS